MYTRFLCCKQHLDQRPLCVSSCDTTSPDQADENSSDQADQNSLMRTALIRLIRTGWPTNCHWQLFTRSPVLWEERTAQHKDRLHQTLFAITTMKHCLSYTTMKHCLPSITWNTVKHHYHETLITITHETLFNITTMKNCLRSLPWKHCLPILPSLPWNTVYQH